MQDPSVNELMSYYVDSLEDCGLLTADESEIESRIFEEFNIGAITFLHNINLMKLKEAGLINDQIMNQSAELRKKFLSLQNSDKWDAKSVKSESEWREVLLLADEIKELLGSEK
ncbi:hypothetical protein [Paenibacillus sp. 2TAB26]|uniref:hypothetical protein n=1 Tax=Paenibacillus sp. 2TAB26 TaxID=3233005 RepID=UPI003F9EA523